MELRTRDFDNERFESNGHVIIDHHTYPTNYHIRVTNDSVDLDHGPVAVMCMGVMQTDDVTHRTVDEVKQWLKRDDMPYSRRFMDMFVTEETMNASVAKQLGEGLDHMCIGYFRYLDEVFFRPFFPLAHEPKSYLLSYRSMEESMQKLFDMRDGKIDPNTYYSDEAMDFVKRIAPAFGDVREVHEPGGKKHLAIAHPKSVAEITEKLKNLTLVGNSTGGFFIVEIRNAMLDMLRQSRFNDKDIRDIFDSMPGAVCIGTLLNTEKIKGPSFRTIFFEGINDRVAELLNPEKHRVTDADIEKFCPPAVRRNLQRAAQAYYTNLDAIGEIPQGPYDASKMDTDQQNIFMPLPGVENNRMTVLSTVPSERKRWALNPWASKRGDAAKQKIANDILTTVGQDYNGHHIAFHMAQGYPPHYLPALVQNILLNMAAFHGLKPEERKNVHISDFMTKTFSTDPALLKVSLDSRTMIARDMLMDPVREGLTIAGIQA